MTPPPSPLLPSERADRGPHAVGVATVAVADGRDPARVLPVDVWYPADPEGAARAPEADHPYGQTHRAAVDAPPLDGPFPLVAFSHGNSGLRRQSTFLTTHLASWGFVVAAPDHVGNTFPEMFQVADRDELVRIHRDARAARPHDLQAVIAQVDAGDARWPSVDATRLGVLGHSFGGWTAFKQPRLDARVRAVCGLAPASEPFVGKKAFEPGELPLPDDVASLVVPGLDDTLVTMTDSMWPLYERLESPRALVGVRDADHYHFCDGLELLHARHEQSPRDGLPKAPRPTAELLNEARMHRLLAGLVAFFFERTLVHADADPFASTQGFEPDALAALDPALERLERPGDGDAPAAAAKGSA